MENEKKVETWIASKISFRGWLITWDQRALPLCIASFGWPWPAASGSRDSLKNSSKYLRNFRFRFRPRWQFYAKPVKPLDYKVHCNIYDKKQHPSISWKNRSPILKCTPTSVSCRPKNEIDSEIRPIFPEIGPKLERRIPSRRSWALRRHLVTKWRGFEPRTCRIEIASKPARPVYGWFWLVRRFGLLWKAIGSLVEGLCQPSIWQWSENSRFIL